jgi:hypothetical protein
MSAFGGEADMTSYQMTRRSVGSPVRAAGPPSLHQLQIARRCGARSRHRLQAALTDKSLARIHKPGFQQNSKPVL